MTTTIKIGGMHCGGCVSSVEKAARAIEGVSNVSVSLDDNALTADLAKPELLDALTGAIEDCGFDVLNTSA
ncbi:heavy metal-associated domain-containing protein [uncultured Hoeflea sp.]|uniref:heavy-metal-associated domain-containing protein n=1 Tax=uncultured Hoeflea sp. TaxID=538666 RepID=UPI0026184BFC|nr:heavy metal-associated domain-containing protein [uncultured Hoeflea sp.]